MTPQDLMNLPYAGMAENVLRNRGMWILTPKERFFDAMSGIENAIDELKSYAEDADTAFRNLEAQK